MDYKVEFERLLGCTLKVNSKGEAQTRCPLHDDHVPSLSLNVLTGVWYCHAGCGSGNINTLAAKLGKSIGYDKEEKTTQELELLNEIVEKFHQNLTQEYREYWYGRGVDDLTLDELKIGYDPHTKYYSFPYFDEKGHCYFYKAVNIQKSQFWYPAGIDNAARIYNIKDISIARKNDSTLYIAEGEKDCLILKKCGYLCVGISGAESFKEEYRGLFEGVNKIIIGFDNDNKGQLGGKKTAEILGTRAKVINWPEKYPKDINDLYLLDKEKFKDTFEKLVSEATSPTKPFLKPSVDRFNEILNITQQAAEKELLGIKTGYTKMDQFTDGLTGIAILGGGPKIGKSTFALAIAANAAENGHPVIYCDFENGAYKLCLKVLSRLSGFTNKELRTKIDDLKKQSNFEHIKERYLRIGKNLFIHRPSIKDIKVNGQSLSDASNMLLEKYAGMKEELQTDKDMLIIIDSLQKLPIWNMSDRRGSIDSWLRAFEKAKDNFGVTFLVISELARGAYDDASITAFKESGDIEYTADLAILMKNGKNEFLEYAIELHAVANRDGEIGLISNYKPFYHISDFEESPANIVRG